MSTSAEPSAAPRKSAATRVLTTQPKHVITTAIDDPGVLLDHLPHGQVVAWLRGGDGLVGWGEAARLEVSGPDRFSVAASWWGELTDRLQITNDVGVAGSGPVAFASFTFDEGPSHSVVVVPQVVVGRRDGASWLTVVENADPYPTRSPIRALEPVTIREGHLPSHAYEAAVARAVESIRAGTLDKVVLARDLIAHTRGSVDVRALLHRLVANYPSCWTFCVDDFLGATPELLVRRTGDHVVSRVLAGTMARGTDAVDDAQRAAELLHSSKDRREHDMAVESVAQALAPFCADLVVPRTPEIVRLANVSHLQTDVTAKLGNGESALDLAAALHPTAAVCGTPTSAARQAIRQLEGFDRGRYAGPVGWVDAAGDGAFGIALRCAHITDHEITMIAGAGIVDGSQPAEELAETEHKFAVMRAALGVAEPENVKQ